MAHMGQGRVSAARGRTGGEHWTSGMGGPVMIQVTRTGPGWATCLQVLPIFRDESLK
jgi:hypothetical protein